MTAIEQKSLSVCIDGRGSTSRSYVHTAVAYSAKLLFLLLHTIATLYVVSCAQPYWRVLLFLKTSLRWAYCAVIYCAMPKEADHHEGKTVATEHACVAMLHNGMIEWNGIDTQKNTTTVTAGCCPTLHVAWIHSSIHPSSVCCYCCSTDLPITAAARHVRNNSNNIWFCCCSLFYYIITTSITDGHNYSLFIHQSITKGIAQRRYKFEVVHPVAFSNRPPGYIITHEFYWFCLWCKWNKSWIT